MTQKPKQNEKNMSKRKWLYKYTQSRVIPENFKARDRCIAIIPWILGMKTREGPPIITGMVGLSPRVVSYCF